MVVHGVCIDVFPVNLPAPSEDILISAAVTTPTDTARTYSDYSGPRGGVAA